MRGDSAAPRLLQHAGGISPGNGHPEGGSVVGHGSAPSVVDDEIKPYGSDDLFVRDVSVLPASIDAGLQLATMALAHYAVLFVLTY